MHGFVQNVSVWYTSNSFQNGCICSLRVLSNECKHITRTALKTDLNIPRTADIFMPFITVVFFMYKSPGLHVRTAMVTFQIIIADYMYLAIIDKAGMIQLHDHVHM